ncbi:DUF1642 domain-containing protein [Lactococcus lactis]|uniref:DUF1642 domain-containing protein n=1 Tax=Lactococcus lactis TaxID=1358 RepID=UPI0024186F05|nr:DUF1642 domain-containing protein [Lactococcus lactis]MDG4962982.1 DUF1642 domain-containing protein [Lactococcus lactis]
MTKFEEELRDKGVEIITQQPGCSMSRKVLINYADVVNLSEGWVSPEAHQARVNELIETKEKNVELLRKNSTLKSQLQQQALPVVPECVGEWIECVKGKNKNALALLDDDNMPDDVNEWLFFQRNDDNINLILRAWLDGYTVEKPQLFYLKHIDMSKEHKDVGWYLVNDGELDHDFDYKGLSPKQDRYKFTQQEIDSMQTGSYELVPVEDGE